MSRSLFDHLEELAPRLQAAPSLALFLDFDGLWYRSRMIRTGRRCRRRCNEHSWP
jgi:hypothetical protein